MMSGVIVLLTIATFESLLSISLNLYIVVIHIRSLRNGMKLKHPSIIQLVMGVTNLSMRGTMLGTSLAFWFPIHNATRLYHAMTIVLPLHLNFSYWLIAWLCTYYWTTITDVQHGIFIWVKRSLISFLPRLLIFSAVASFTVTVQLTWNVNIHVSYGNSTLKKSFPKFKISFYNFSLLLISCICTCLPFVIILGSLGMTMSSMFRHIWKVKRNVSGLASPNLKAHTRAVRTMTFLLVLSVGSNVAEIIKLMFISIPEDGEDLSSVFWVMVGCFALAEASIIIQSSRKLKKTFLQMFRAGSRRADK